MGQIFPELNIDIPDLKWGSQIDQHHQPSSRISKKQGRCHVPPSIRPRTKQRRNPQSRAYARSYRTNRRPQWKGPWRLQRRNERENPAQTSMARILCRCTPRSKRFKTCRSTYPQKQSNLHESPMTANCSEFRRQHIDTPRNHHDGKSIWIQKTHPSVYSLHSTKRLQ